MKITKTITLPADAATQKVAMIGRTGSGKSYASMKYVELLLEHGDQAVILDPVGIWWALRLAKDGKTPSPFNIPIVGGLHGDVPLDVNAGAMLADLIVDRNASMVIDVSMFETDAEKTRFATAFANRFFFRKKASPSPVCLVLEECQEFIPQNVQRGEEKMLHEFTRIWKIGRNYGIGGILISQRPQEVNKKVLNQTEVLFAFQTTGPHERKTIVEWVKDKALDTTVADDLPKLQKGYAHLWSPTWLQVSEVVKVLEKKTFDASSTPTQLRKAIKTDLSPKELAVLQQQFQETIEKQKQNDPAELRKEIARLQKELRSQKPADTEELNRLQGLNKRYEVAVVSRDEEIQRLNKALATIGKIVGDASSEFVKLDSPKPVNYSGPAPVRGNVEPAKRIERPATPASPLNGALPAGEQKVLGALIQYPNGLESNQLTVLTGYKRSTRDAYIQRLGEKGLTTKSNGKVYATDAGRAALPDFEPLPTGVALQDFWRNRLPAGEWKILELLIKTKSESVSRDWLTEQTNFQRSTRDAYIQRLASKELVTATGPGEVKASDNLFI